MKQLAVIAEQLEFSPEVTDWFKEYWRETSEAFPGMNNLEFLKNDYIRKYSTMAGVPEAAIQEIIYLKNRLWSRPSVIQVMWHYSYLLYLSGLHPSVVLQRNPELTKSLGPAEAGCFHYLLALAGFPLGITNYQTNRWPERIRNQTFRDLSVWVEHYKENHDSCGISWTILNWIQGHLRCTLVQLGRLQFNTSHLFVGNIHGFRHRDSGDVCVLYGNGARFNSEGLIDGLRGMIDPEGWESHYEDKITEVTGHPVTPNGRCKPEPVTLKMTEWNRVLEQKDQMINIHIPAGGSLTVEACRDSVERAVEFFQEYCPDFEWKGFCCYSWFLDPQLQLLLPPESNIIGFQRAGYLYPFGGESDAIFRVFGEKGVRDGVSVATCRNSMQRRLAEFVEQGGIFRTGALFLLKEDLPWGGNPYWSDAK